MSKSIVQLTQSVQLARAASAAARAAREAAREAARARFTNKNE